MKAVIYEGTGKIGVQNVPTPILGEDTDALVRVTSATICGTDIRLYWGTMTSMIPLVPGDQLGHEFVGVIVERFIPSFRRRTCSCAAGISASRQY